LNSDVDDPIGHIGLRAVLAVTRSCAVAANGRGAIAAKFLTERESLEETLGLINAAPNRRSALAGTATTPLATASR
jgi:hypothetical protein